MIVAAIQRASAALTAELSPDDIQQLWQDYQATGSKHLRNKLMTIYLPLVRFIADRIHSKLPHEVELDDLISAGSFGLMDAIDSFDLSRGFKFETYCAPRIRGAILDELRSMDWVPRLVRARSSQVEQARKSLLMQLGRSPSDEELAQELDVSPEEFQRILRDSDAVAVTSLDRKCYDNDAHREVHEVDILDDPRQPNPLSAVGRRDLRDTIIRGLSRAERMVVILYYYEQLTMREIGLVLDLSESRVSQMHTAILARLRARLRHCEQELNAPMD